MNSWHSWSPNGKWLVFSSKAYSVYTQLLLTHIDSEGRSTPPAVLANFTEEGRAANIPEFANIESDAIRKIHEQFLDDTHYLRAGDEFSKQGEYENAIRLYRRAVDINPDNAAAHANWGTCLMYLGKLGEAEGRLMRAIALKPDLWEPHCTLGVVLRQQNKLREAAGAFRGALQAKPDFALAQLHLGTLLLDLGQFDQAKEHLAEAARLDPRDPFAPFNLGAACGRAEQTDEAAVYFTEAVERDPDFVPALVHLALIRSTSKDESLRDGEQAVQMATRACELTRHQHPEALHALAAAYAEVGRFPAAVSTAEHAVRLARSGGNEALAQAIQKPLGLYKQRQPFRSDSR
jgi:tetratricopeptide (TPR) repeat protein